MALKPIEICSIRRDWPETDYVCLILRKPGENFFLPIWISPERYSVALEVFNPDAVALNRPSTFYIIQELNKYLRSPISEARIDAYHEGIFMASLALDDGTLIEARALDAIMISRILDIPLLVDSEVLHTNGIRVAEEDVRTYLKLEPVAEPISEDAQNEERSQEVDRFAAFMRDMGVSEEDFFPPER